MFAALIVEWGIAADISLAEDKDKNGVSPNTISLPSGPGSIEGLGESFQPMLNTGTAKYAVRIGMPPGVAGNTPELALQYDGALGDGPAGIGWSYGPGSIGRQVDKGIPRYVDGPNELDDDHDGEIDEADEVDTFLGPDGEELVRLSDGTYRARIEGNFARYRRVNDYWEVDLKNGTVLTFGASQGARVSDEAGLKIFRWLLEKSEDINGNVINYSYSSFPESDNQRYLYEIRWGPASPPWSVFYVASFIYEDRPDWRKDYRSGYLVRTAKRLSEIRIAIQGVQPPQCAPGDWNSDSVPDALIKRLTIEYDPSSHISHLAKITRYGADGVNYLPPILFAYSTYSPSAVISAKDVIVRSENIPSVMDDQLADLIDLNRDGLPDILKTDFSGGGHVAYRNLGAQLQGSRHIIRWDEPISMASEDQLALSLHLAEDRVSLADMDGDGLSDLVHTTFAREVFYYPNQGDFSWGARRPMSIQDVAPPAPFAFEDVKSTDLDFNKRMDVVMSTENGYAIWFNYEDGGYSLQVRTAGANWQGRTMLFTDPGFDFADMNGDRLTDAVRITPTRIVYAASMGHGLFAGAVEIPIPDTVLTDGTNGQVERAKITDVNGDGLSDLVVERAVANELWFWLNLGTDSFSNKYVITDMPTQFGSDTVIRWADLNGNGTTDIIYADSSAVAKLRMIDIGELVGGSAHPNLLTAIDNGLGVVTSIAYKSSTEHYLAAAAAGEPWTSTVPFPVQAVTQVTTVTGLDLDDQAGNDEYLKDYLYRDGFYEDREKQFRGFAKVKVTEYGDVTAPAKVSYNEFFTGGPDGLDNDGDGDVDEESPELHREEDALKGMVRSLELRDEAGTLYARDENSWLVRNLVVSPDGIEVRFAYNERADKLIYEGTETPETVRKTFLYDDYGNVTEEKNYGALSITGDEAFTYTEYINDASAWMLGFQKRQYVTDALGEMAAETLIYYDGADYVGLSLGQLTLGRLSRQQRWVSDSTYVDAVRSAYDSYGNITGILEPRGYGRSITWDSTLHTYPISEAIEVGGGSPDLVISASYNLGLGVVTGSTDFNGHQNSYEYDVFGRIASIIRPGDSQALPTQTFAYRMADPIKGLLYSYDTAGELTLSASAPVPSSVSTFGREVSGQPGTFDMVQYIDGLGRNLALMEEAESGFVVNEAVRFNAFGTKRYSFLPYAAATSAYTVPALNPSVTETHYDVTGRPVTVINPPDADSNVTSSSVQYLPLQKTTTDENGISKEIILDGLERVAEVHEHNQGQTYITGYEYDVPGNLTSITDAQSNIRAFYYDGLSRKTAMEDPDRGYMAYAYDAAGNLIETTDNKGQVVQYTYDGARRMLTEDYLDAAGITPDIAYRYDSASADYPTAGNLKGKLASVTDLSGGKFFSYDDRGNVLWNINRIADGQERRDFRSEYEYDAQGRVTKMTYPDGDQVSYAYDNGSNLQAVPGIVDGIEYHASGAISAIAYANGMQTTYAFDHRYRMRRLTTDSVQAGGPVQDLEYTFDGVSNVLAISDHRSIPPTDPSNGSQTFVYDDLYRLTHAEGSGYGSISYQYDSIGNMIFKGSVDIGDPLINLGVMSYGGTGGTNGRGVRQPGDAPGPHAITATDSGLVYDYDDNGNMISHAAGDVYEWDYQDRLIRVQTADSVSTYVYDASGTRVIKKVLKDGTENVTWYVNDAFELREGKQVKFVFTDDRRVARVEGSLIQPGASTYQTLDFHTGWNFFSLTVEPDDPAVTAVLSPIAGKYTQAWRFDATSQSYVGHNPASSIYDLTELHAGIGYAIHVTEDAALLVRGTRAASAHSLLAGWNLIGGPVENSQPVAEAFAGMQAQLTAAWEFDNPVKQWQSYLTGDTGFLSTLEQVAPGTANWVKATENTSFSYPQNTDIFFYHPDHLGSSGLVSDSTGAVVERTEYYPYGRPRYEQRTGFDSAYKYTGKELDKDTGLMYHEARYYDAVVGRFATFDPARTSTNAYLVYNPQKLSPYSYVENRPLIMIDPSGLDSEDFYYGPQTAEEANSEAIDALKEAIESKDPELLSAAIQVADETRDLIQMGAFMASPENILSMLAGGIDIVDPTMDETSQEFEDQYLKTYDELFKSDALSIREKSEVLKKIFRMGQSDRVKELKLEGISGFENKLTELAEKANPPQTEREEKFFESPSTKQNQVKPKQVKPKRKRRARRAVRKAKAVSESPLYGMSHPDCPLQSCYAE